MPKLSITIKFIAGAFFTLCLFVFTGCKDCSKKVPCPGYEDAVLDAWFPYFNNQVLVFKNNSNVYDSIILQLTDSTIAYDFTTGLGRSNSGCNASKAFASVKKDSSNYPAFGILLSSALPAFTTTPNRAASFNFKNRFFTGQDLQENGFASFMLPEGVYRTPVSLNNFLLNGKIYPIAQYVLSDTAQNNAPGAYKIIYAKNYGIIAYETNPGAISWVKQ